MDITNNKPTLNQALIEDEALDLINKYEFLDRLDYYYES